MNFATQGQTKWSKIPGCGVVIDLNHLFSSVVFAVLEESRFFVNYEGGHGHKAFIIKKKSQTRVWILARALLLVFKAFVLDQITPAPSICLADADC